MLNRNYRYLIVLLFCLLPSLACAGYVINSFGTFGGSGGGGTTYIGWANVAGVPTGTPPHAVPSGDILNTSQWTATPATSGGTATTINAYIVTALATHYESVVLYKDIEGTITLVGQGVFTGSDGTWTGAITLVAEGGQSLDFTSTDVLYYGVGASTTSGSSYSVGRDDANGTGMYHNNDDRTAAPATTTFLTSNNRDMGFVFGYTTP